MDQELIVRKDENLREYQQSIKETIAKEWETNHSIMLQMPTGTGKTRLFVSLISDIISSQPSAHVLILTHRNEIKNQINAVFCKYGIKARIIEKGTFSPWALNDKIVLAMQTTLSRHNWRTDYLYSQGHISAFDYIIIDEAHHTKADSYRKVLKIFSNAKVLGVTATPYRMNGEGFTRLFDTLIVSPPVGEFIQQGYLSPYRYLSIAADGSIQECINSISVLQNTGEYNMRDLSRKYDTSHIRTNILDLYLNHAQGLKGIVYAIDKYHSKTLCALFVEHGIKANYIDNNTNDEVRDCILEQFKRGAIDVLFNVNIFTEGFDCPDVEFILLARPTKSMSLYLQQVGRGLRIPEKPRSDKLIILDAAGLYNAFGTPTAPRDWVRYFLGEDADISVVEELREKVESNIYHFRLPDYSEGDEDVIVIEETDSVIEIEEKEIHKEDVREKIDSIIAEIDENILAIYDKYIVHTPFAKSDLIHFSAEYSGNIFNPYVNFTCKYDKQDERIKEYLQYELKPVSTKHGIEYSFYDNIEEFEENETLKMKTAFLDKFPKFMESVFSKLDDFDIWDLINYFEGNNLICKKKCNDILYGQKVPGYQFKDFKHLLILK